MSRTFKDEPQHVKTRKYYLLTGDLKHDHSLVGRTLYTKVLPVNAAGEEIDRVSFDGSKLHSKEHRDFIYSLQSQGISYTESFYDYSWNSYQSLEEVDGSISSFSINPYVMVAYANYSPICNIYFINENIKHKSFEILQWKGTDENGKILNCYPREEGNRSNVCSCCIPQRDEKKFIERSERQSSRLKNIQYLKAHYTGIDDDALYDYE